MVTLLFLLTFLLPHDKEKCNCERLKDSGDNYLMKICEYIQKEKLDVRPGDPCRYQIREIREQNLKEQEVIAVYLDCCHTGDIAFFDKKTKELIKFRLGNI